MGFIRNIIDKVISENTSIVLLWGYAITAVIDIILTYYLLTYVVGTWETNQTADLFQKTFGIIPGLIILTIIILISLLILDKIFHFVSEISKSKILLGIWNVLLLFIFFKSFLAILNNVNFLLIQILPP